MPCHKLYKDKGALEIWQEEMAHVDMYIKHLWQCLSVFSMTHGIK